MCDIKNIIPRRSLTELITHPISNSIESEREIKEHLYNKFFPEPNNAQMRCKPLDDFLKNLNILLSKYDDRAFSIKAGGKAWERFYKEEVAEAEKAAETEKAFQPLNSDIFIFCDNNLINKIFNQINELLNEFDTYLNTLNRDIVKSEIGEQKIRFEIEKVSLDEINDKPIKTILFPCHSFRVIYSYWLNNNKIFNGDILYVSFFPVTLNFSNFKQKFTNSYITKVNDENFLNNEGLHFFGNKIDGNRSLEKGMNIDQIRMDELLNKYHKSQVKLPEFHTIYESVFSGTDLYSRYDKIKLNHLYFADTVDNIKKKIKKSVVQSFREYAYLILKDIEKNFVDEFGQDKSITLLVGGESMSFYGITKREDTDDYDIKVFYDKDVKRECAKKIIYEILSKYVVLLKKAFPLEEILLQHKNVSLKSNRNSLARLRLIKSICKDYDLFSIDFKIIVKELHNDKIESIAIDIPILDVSIVKKDIKKFKSMFSAINIKQISESNKQEINITKEVDIIISKKRERELSDDDEYKNQRGGMDSNTKQNTDPSKPSEVSKTVEEHFNSNKEEMTEEMTENITDKYFEYIDSQKEDDNEKQEEMKEMEKEIEVKQQEMEVEKQPEMEVEMEVEQEEMEVEKQWKINIPTLFYYIYDYYYMYGNKNNKKLRILAQKNEKDQKRYDMIKEMIASSLNENIRYLIDYKKDFKKFLYLSHNSEKIMTDINFYRKQFKDLMISTPTQQKIRMKFENSQDKIRITTGGGANNQYSYFLADLFQNILDSIFFYHKSF